jgi:hypothetical protein
VLLAGVAGLLAFVRAPLGLAFALAVPVFPLGNVSSGLAVAYAALAVVWLVLMWGDARRGLLFCTGIVLGPIGLLGLMPLVVMNARGTVRRAAHALAAVLLAGAAAAIHGSDVPFAGEGSAPLGIAGSEHPVGAAQEAWGWLAARPELVVEAVILAAAAASLRLVVRRTDLTIAAFAGALLAGMLLAAPEAGAFALVLSGWATYLALTVMSRRLPERAADRRTFGARVRQTGVNFLDRLKSGGGMRWPQGLPRFRQADAR